MTFFRKNWPYILLILFIVLGIFFRFWDLSNVPPGVYPDEAKNANDAIETLQTGEYKLFYPENNGREGLYIWLIALSFQLFGINIFALKFISALIGALTILGTYLLAKELITFADQYTTSENLRIGAKARETVAVLSSGFLAVSFWHINFSRIGFRAIFVPLLLSFGMYFLMRAYRTRKSSLYIWAGIIWGAGFYTYIAFRVAYLIPIFFLALMAIFYMFYNPPRFSMQWVHKVFIRDGWWKVKALLGGSVIAVMAPMLVHFYKNPEFFVERAGGISVFDTANPILEFLKSFVLHIQMLVFMGDNNWRHNFAGEPQLFWPVAILFIFGFWYSLKTLKSDKRAKNWTGIAVHLTLMFSLAVMILPGALTIESIPHALRTIGMMPFVFIYAAFGFLYLVQKMFPHRYHQEDIWPFVVSGITITIMLIASFQFSHYFIDWGKSAEVEGAFSKNYVEIGNYFNELEERNNVHKYLIVNSGGVDVTYPKTTREDGQKLPMSAQTTLFIQQTHTAPPQNTSYILENEIPRPITQPSVFVPLEANDEIKNFLRQNHPTGREFQFEYFWAWGVGITQ